MDANSGGPWSEMDISDLTNELAAARRWRKPLTSFAETRTRFGRRRGNWDWLMGLERKAPPERGVVRHQRLTRRAYNDSVFLSIRGTAAGPVDVPDVIVAPL